VTLAQLLYLGVVLFCIGLYGVLTRRNFMGILLSVEVMANAVNVVSISFSRFTQNLLGQVFAVFVMALTVAEVVVGLALVILLYRTMRHTDIDEASHLRH
jgi:NADH:ubiquinone oxidoreductase subunit K